MIVGIVKAATTPIIPIVISVSAKVNPCCFFVYNHVLSPMLLQYIKK